METAIEVFKRRLEAEWLPSFCNDPKRGYSTTGFKPESIKVTEFDAECFLRALDSGLVKDVGGGRYWCKKSSTFEQIFWSGSKSVALRPITLWLEPVITIGTIARLTFLALMSVKCGKSEVILAHQKLLKLDPIRTYTTLPIR